MATKDESTEDIVDETADPPTPSKFGEVGRPFNRNYFQHGVYAGLGLMVVYVLYLCLDILMPMLIIIAVAGFLAIGLNPMVRRLNRWGLPRPAAVAAVCLGALLVLCTGVVSIIPPIVEESTAFIEEAPSLVQSLGEQRWLVKLDEQFDILAKLEEMASDLKADTVVDAAGGVFSVLGVAVGSVFNGVMIAVLTIYLLASFDRITHGFYRLLPARRRTRARALGDEILTKVGGYTVGALGIAAAAGCTSFVFMLIAGVPYAYALAFIVAILDLIPQIGATLGAIVVTLVGLTVSLWVAIACAIFFVIYQQIENWIIYPTIMRRSVKVSDLAAILGLLLGAALLGVVGALLAVPTVAAVQLLVREVYIPRQDQT